MIAGGIIYTIGCMPDAKITISPFIFSAVLFFMFIRQPHILYRFFFLLHGC